MHEILPPPPARWNAAFAPQAPQGDAPERNVVFEPAAPPSDLPQSPLSPAVSQVGGIAAPGGRRPARALCAGYALAVYRRGAQAEL